MVKILSNLIIPLLLILCENLSSFSLMKFKSTGYDEQAESEKRRRIIEMSFGSDPTTSEDPVIGELEVPEIPQANIETVAQAIPDFKKYGVVTADENKILEKRDETPLTEVEHENYNDLDIKRGISVLCSDKDTQGQLSDNLNVFDEIAKRCLNSPGDKIDSKLLEHMEQLGILQTMVKGVPKMEDETVQIGCTKRTRKPRPKIEAELETPIFDKDRMKTPRRNFINRRAMRHIALRLGTFDVSQLKTDIIMKPEQNKAPMKESTELLEFKNAKNKVADDHLHRQEQELSYVLDPTPPLNSKLTGIPTDEMTIESEYESKSPAMTLSEEFADDQNYEVNLSNVCCKQAGHSELDIGLEEIKRMFDEEKIPRHAFMSMKPSTKQDETGSKQDDFVASEKSSNDDNTCPFTNSVISHTRLSPKDAKLSAKTVPSGREPVSSDRKSNEAAMKVDSHVNEIVQYPMESMDHCRHSNAQSHAVLSTLMNKQLETNNEQSSATTIVMQKQELTYKNENISLSEMLRRVRQRALLESVEHIVFTSQVTETNSSVVQKQAPCAPLATPPNPKVVPPRPCPCKRPKPKTSNPCAPPKKNTCEKFHKTTLVDTFGVIVTRVPEVDVPQNWPDKALDNEPIPKASTVMFVPEAKYFVRSVNNMKCQERNISKRVLNFIRDYETCDPCQKK